MEASELLLRLNDADLHHGLYGSTSCYIHGSHVALGIGNGKCRPPHLKNRTADFNNNNNTQLLSCHVSTDTVKTVGVESQARVVAGYWL